MFILRVLGTAVLEGPQGRVKGPAAQRRRIAVLVALTRTRRRPLAREKLIALVWPEHNTDAGRHLLAQALYHIRKSLCVEPFETPGDDIVLKEDVLTSDANEFEDALTAGDLERAVGLYRGDFLDGFFLPEAGEFERWVEEERSRLKRAFGQVLEQLAEAAEGVHEPLRAAEWWQRAAHHEPYSSRLILRLMRALEWGGEHLAAIRAAERHSEFLQEDIGASPDPEVLAYAERLRTNPSQGRLLPLPERESSRDDAPGDAKDQERGNPDGTADSSASNAPDADVTGVERGERSSGSSPNQRRGAAGSAGVRHGIRRPVLLASALLALATLAVGLLAVLRTRPGATAAHQSASQLDPRRVAVLYFDDLSEHASAGHIAAGLTEALIHELAQVRSLDVVSRNGVKPFRGRNVGLDSIVSVLRAGSVVEGSVQREEGRLRVTVQLIDASTGTHLQSRSVVRPLGELLELEDEVASEVSRFLRVRLGQEIRLRSRLAGTRNAEAREAMLRADELFGRTERATGEPDPLGPAVRLRTLGRADSLLALAEQGDSDWLEPAIRRGWIWLSIAETLPERERLPAFMRALQHSERVLARDSGHPEALELRGTARWGIARLDHARSMTELHGLMGAAEQDLKAALEAEPTRASAWSTLSQYLRLQGRLPEADVAARRALEADEFLADADLILERLYRSSLLVGRFDESLRWCDEGRRRFPSNWRFVECELTLLGYGEGTQGDVARAWALRRQLEQLDPASGARASARGYTPLFRDMNVALVLARAGMRDSARAVMARARRAAGVNPELTTSLAYDEARVAFVLADTALALRKLGEYVNATPRARGYIAHDVTFTGLREHPAFRAIIRSP